MKQMSQNEKVNARQKFAPYTEWEDWQNGMYHDVTAVEFERLAKASQSVLSSEYTTRAAMMRVVSEWPVSTAVNMSNESQNRRSWLGQAACCISVKSPEDATRVAWSRLSDSERKTANTVADEIIALWEENERKEDGKSNQKRLF
jgi:hypothetical protein